MTDFDMNLHNYSIDGCHRIGKSDTRISSKKNIIHLSYRMHCKKKAKNKKKTKPKTKKLLLVLTVKLNIYNLKLVPTYFFTK